MKRKITTRRIHDALNALDRKANVSGFIVLDGAGKHVGTVRFSYPRDGAGKLQAFAANWLDEMPADFDVWEWTRWQYGWANGYGYDKHTAALSGMTIGAIKIEDGGHRWDNQLQSAGYTVLQAV